MVLNNDFIGSPGSGASFPHLSFDWSKVIVSSFTYSHLRLRSVCEMNVRGKVSMDGDWRRLKADLWHNSRALMYNVRC